jgi:hypothetical protein
MGTGHVQRDKIPEIIKEFDAFKERIFRIMGGDDTLFDHFQRAKKRMEELADPGYTGLGPDGRSPVRHCTGHIEAGYGTDESSPGLSVDGVSETFKP